MCLCEKNTKIYINIFVHYPEVYNANTICEKLNFYFKPLFSDNNLIDYIDNCYVMINSAPHNEEELIEVEFNSYKKEMLLLIKDTISIKVEELIMQYFNNQITNILIKFVE